MPADPFPRDFGAKIHPSHPTDQKLYAHNPEIVPFVVCKFHRASWFINQSRSAFLSPEQNLFITTYEMDKHLVNRTPTHEVDRLEKLDGIADGAFTGDRFTYESMNRREVTKEIEESVERQLTANRLMDQRGMDLPHYPSIMGWKDWHYERCRILLDEISRSVGFDATQYNSKYQLSEDVNTLNEVLKPDQIFINGCIAPSWLRMLPRTIVACSGSWNIRKESEDWREVPQPEKLPAIIEKRVAAINSWQSELTNYL